MQQQPIGPEQQDFTNVATTHQTVPFQTLQSVLSAFSIFGNIPDPAPTFSLDNPEFAVGMSSPLSPDLNSVTTQSPSGDLHGSPVAEWRDTPRTLYKNSPETEVGDNDVLSDLDVEGTEGEEDTSRSEQDRRSSQFNTYSQQPIMSEEPTFADCNLLSEVALQTFARRLHADIRSTSSLFPGISVGSLARSSAPIHQLASSERLRTNVVSQAIPDAADVTRIGEFSRPRSIPRRRSMHLKHPSNPINPYHRPIAGEKPPAHRYPAAAIDRTYLKRFRNSSPPQRTVSMKELLVPHAEFRFGYDPEALALELDTSTTQGFKSIDDGIGDGAAGDHLDTSTQDANTAPPTPDITPAEPPTDDIDCWDMLDSADDGTWTPEASGEGLYEPRAKRRRTNTGAPSRPAGESGISEDSRIAQQVTTRNRRAHHDTTKGRKRHLQPNLVRTNGCLYGCPLLFSTAYEARRHQEDTHGREEAYQFIRAASGDLQGPIVAKDYRFLLQIALHALGDKLESRARTTLDEALERDGEELDASLVDTVARFARDWTKRYECPRCGASFSRLDSKKRHYEKQCR
ncbi:hypothetical protein FRC04_006846 [Tulasnella sp. 424]|nr:hypothetical protein FRC04_006846 [Tulasnella sp. 424]KAG8974353.1 hypothetical protein FRC05_007514 [Tulasnella sp. 425]